MYTFRALEAYDPASNLIEVYINRLRRKIDREHAEPYLQTRRGAGYVLQPPRKDGAA